MSEQIPDQVPLGKPQRLDGQAYESPALPLSYSAEADKSTERERRPQSARVERITIEQHITLQPRRPLDFGRNRAHRRAARRRAHLREVICGMLPRLRCDSRPVPEAWLAEEPRGRSGEPEPGSLWVPCRQAVPEKSGTKAPRSCLACEISAGYTRRMAKVLISMPDDLLERIDREADARGSNRSRFLQDAARRELGWPSSDALEAALTRGREALASVSGFESAELIREQRRARDAGDRRR